MPEFVYSIRDLQNGLQEVRAPLSQLWLQAALADTDLVPAPESSGAVDVRVSLSGKDVVVVGTVRATVLMECGRCLEPTQVSVCGELALLLCPGELPQSPADGPSKSPRDRPTKRNRQSARDDAEHENSADDANADSYFGDEVVLDGFLREAILLELPIFPLCSEECPGIGPVPPDVARIAQEPPSFDPRLAPLLEFQKKKLP